MAPIFRSSKPVPSTLLANNLIGSEPTSSRNLHPQPPPPLGTSHPTRGGGCKSIPPLPANSQTRAPAETPNPIPSRQGSPPRAQESAGNRRGRPPQCRSSDPQS